jgi:lysophospholipid acyltransferase (LPLAT)-like uncharacterized protein
MTRDNAAELPAIAEGADDTAASVSRSHMEAFISDSRFAQLRVESPNVDRAYSFADLSPYSWKDRFMIRVADLAFFVLINLIGRTMKFEVEGFEHHETVTDKGRLPVYTFWHDRILATTYWWRNCRAVVLTSRSFDGEYIARFIQRFGYGAVRGSSTRGAVGAVVEMARVMRAGCPTCFVVDGPKGPPYVAKMGAVLLAKRSGHPIVPVTMALHRLWKLPSWDSFQIPKPFTRAKIFVAPPIYVAADANEEELERKRAELQQVLDDLNARAERWRANL